jgi:long-chain acyl-CoA synthetase
MSLLHEALYPQMTGRGPFTVEAAGAEKVEGETIPRRHPVAHEKLISRPSEDVKTIFDIIRRSADKFGNAKALGHRKVIKTHQETKMIKKTIDGKTQEVEKKWTYFELSGYNYMSFTEYERLVLQLGSGLRKIGMNKNEILHLFASTR